MVEHDKSEIFKSAAERVQTTYLPSFSVKDGGQEQSQRHFKGHKKTEIIEKISCKHARPLLRNKKNPFGF
jgi:hypothetical protein